MLIAFVQAQWCCHFMHCKPTVVSVSGCDIYRDGGSLGAFFDAGENSSYELHFPVQLSGDEDFQVVGYLGPKLIRGWQTERMSPVTGLSSLDWHHCEEMISWVRARCILGKIKRKAQSLSEREQEILGWMIDIAKRDGARAL